MGNFSENIAIRNVRMAFFHYIGKIPNVMKKLSFRGAVGDVGISW